MAAAISPVVAILLFIVLVLECRKKGRQIVAAFCGAGLVVAFPAAARVMHEFLIWSGTEGARLVGNGLGAIFSSIG